MWRRMNTRFIAVSLGATLTFFTANARADDAPAPPTRDAIDTPAPPTRDAIDAPLDARIEDAAEQGHASRTANAIAGGAGAAVLLPAGIALTQRSDAVSQSVGTGLAVNGGFSLLLTALSLRTSNAELLARRFELRRASGLPHDALVRETEADWSAVADASARRRHTAGVVEVVLGTALTAAGTALLLAPSGTFDMSRNTQYTVGSLVLGPGLPIVSVGVHSILVKTPEEASWERYHAYAASSSLSTASLSPASLSLTSVGLAPTKGGASAFVTVSF
jgi:hypothetical protein